MFEYVGKYACIKESREMRKRSRTRLEKYMYSFESAALAFCFYHKLGENTPELSVWMVHQNI